MRGWIGVERAEEKVGERKAGERWVEGGGNRVQETGSA
jgi:hypothetical protein